MAKRSKGALIGWPGSKRVFADKIVRLMPETTFYCEAFCGSLAVLMARTPSLQCEVVNDAHNELINLFHVVKDMPDELIAKIDLTLTSEWFFNDLKKTPIETLGDVDRAFRFLYLNRLSFGMYGEDTSWTISTQNRISHYRAEYLQGKIRKVHKRLENVHITCRDYKGLLRIKEFSNPNSLIYLDPPYFETANRGYANANNFNHREFFKWCKDLKARVILSHSYHPDVHKYFRDWESVALIVRTSHLERQTDKPKKRYKEMVYANFPLRNTRRSLF